MFVQVTTVCLDNLGLRKIAHLDQFPNLRWLSLASNALNSLEVNIFLLQFITFMFFNRVSFNVQAWKS